MKQPGISPLNFMESKEGLSTTVGGDSHILLGLSQSKIKSNKSRKEND
jgi:hypothetical protein